MSGVLQLSDGSSVAVADGMLLGRVAQCDVVIEDGKASRRHARLVVEGGVVEIEDLGSSNGTLLNGSKIKRRMLRDGDQIQIGKTRIRYLEAEPAPPARGDEPAPGEDLFGDDDPFEQPPEKPFEEDVELPGADLEGDPRTGFVESRRKLELVEDPQPVEAPKPAAAPRLIEDPEPVEQRAPKSADEPAPSASGSAGADVEVLEFVDEVVEVRKRPAEPSPPRASRGAAGPAVSAGPAAGRRPHGVLQFKDKSGRKGLLGDDLQQMSSAKRACLVVLALAAAAGLGYAAMQLVG